MNEQRSFLHALRGEPGPGGPVDDTAHVRVDGTALSWAGLHASARRLAARLPDAGPLAVCAVPTIETVIAVTTGILTGTTVVPVPPDAGPVEVAHVITDSHATCWAGPARAGVDVPVVDVEVVPGGHDHAAVESWPPIEQESVAMILYTSGTTGVPKGVVLSHRALAAGIDGLADAWDWTAEDTVVHGLPLFHTHGLILGVLGSLHVGSRIAHTGRPTPQRYAATPGTMYLGVPTVWSRIVADVPSARALAHARLLVSGSAPLPIPVLERLRELTGQSPVERYGMTETMVTLSCRADGERRPGWVGTPLIGARTRIRTEDGAQAPADGETIGELQVRGPMLFTEYLGQPEATAKAWTNDGWFATGDLATRDAEGFHRIVGRESVDLITSGGYRIGAGEIETSLLARPEVLEVAVVGVPDADLGQRIVAFVVTRPEHTTDDVAGQLVDHVANDVSRHKRPRDIRFVTQLPRNEMGKVQKRTLMG